MPYFVSCLYYNTIIISGNFICSNNIQGRKAYVPSARVRLIDCCTRHYEDIKSLRYRPNDTYDESVLYGTY